MKVICPNCKCETEKSTGHVNRANKLGAPLYCGRTCAGIGRRTLKTIEQKKAEKALYDSEYRDKNKDKIKIKKHEYFKATYDKEKASIDRKAKMHIHIERMRQPKWVEYKKAYDKVHRAKKIYGEFWECFLITEEIQSLYDDKEVRQINNLHNKSQKRKKSWQSQLR